MNIAVANSKFASPNLGGGVTSLHTLLEGIHQKYNISVDAFQTPPVKHVELGFPFEVYSKDPRSVPIFHWVNEYVQNRQLRDIMSANMDRDYDLVIGQDEVGLGAIEAAKEHRVPSILFIRSLGATGYYQYHPRKSHLSNLFRADLGGKIQYPFVLQNYRRYRRAVSDADIVVANSEFTASKLEALFDISPEIIYPPITISDYQTEYNSDGAIMMVNPRTKQKGGDIFLEIADTMGHEDFRLVGPAPSFVKKKADSLDNVTYVEWSDDMKAEYGKAKCLIVPTQWDEPFGRVAAEAMTSGIPCVVSNKGGLPEVVGETGCIVKSVRSVDEWCSKTKYAIQQGYCKNRVKRVSDLYAAEVQINKIQDIISNNLCC